MAEETYPWHPVALGVDVPAGVARAVILDGTEIVVWRGTDGQVHAWDDRCPHRGMRLSFGFVRGNSLNCLYHGWEYEGSSRCVRIPAHPDLEVPKTIRATAYAVIEQNGLVWVCLGPGRDNSPASLGETSPIASVAVACPAASIGPGPVVEIEGMLIAVHPVSAGKSMLHGLLSGKDATVADRLAGARALRTFRRRLEAMAEAA